MASNSFTPWSVVHAAWPVTLDADDHRYPALVYARTFTVGQRVELLCVQRPQIPLGAGNYKSSSNPRDGTRKSLVLGPRSRQSYVRAPASGSSRDE